MTFAMEPCETGGADQPIGAGHQHAHGAGRFGLR